MSENKIITRNQKLLLEPILAGINEDLESKEDEEIIEMIEACESASRTNCWVFTYQAAKYLQPLLIEHAKSRGIFTVISQYEKGI